MLNVAIKFGIVIRMLVIGLLVIGAFVSYWLLSYLLLSYFLGVIGRCDKPSTFRLLASTFHLTTYYSPLNNSLLRFRVFQQVVVGAGYVSQVKFVNIKPSALAVSVSRIGHVRAVGLFFVF